MTDKPNNQMERFSTPVTMTIKVVSVMPDKQDDTLLCLYGIGTFRKPVIEGTPGTIFTPAFKVKKNDHNAKLAGAVITATFGIDDISSFYKKADPENGQKHDKQTLFCSVYSLNVAAYGTEAQQSAEHIPAPSQPSTTTSESQTPTASTNGGITRPARATSKGGSIGDW